jgi:hypothetical protein
LFHFPFSTLWNEIAYCGPVTVMVSVNANKSGNPYRRGRGRLSTIDLLVKTACFVKKEEKIVIKAADLS